MKNTRSWYADWADRLVNDLHGAENETLLIRIIAGARGAALTGDMNKVRGLRAIAASFGKASAAYNELQSLRSIVDVMGVTPAGRYLGNMNELDCLRAIVGGTADGGGVLNPHPECAIIAGATSSTYEQTEADIGFYIRCKITATNSEGVATSWSNSLGPVQAAPPPSYLVNQGFETPTTGYDNGETWSSEGTGLDPAYTVAPLVGSQSFRNNGASAYAGTTFTGAATIYAYCKINFASLTGDSGNILSLWTTGAGAAVVTLNVDGSAIRIRTGLTVSSPSATSLSTATTWHVWLKGVSGGTCELAMSTDGVRPTVDGSGAVFLTQAVGAGNAAEVYLENSVTPGDYKADRVLVSATAIGNNP